eukprot:767320-Hanusia_phi.AAC.21
MRGEYTHLVRSREGWGFRRQRHAGAGQDGWDCEERPGGEEKEEENKKKDECMKYEGNPRIATRNNLLFYKKLSLVRA